MRTTLLCVVFLMGACGGSGRTNPTPDPDAQVPDDGSTDAPPPPSASCGGRLGEGCAANEYCDYPDNSCGVADQPGSCKRRPDACPLTAEAGSLEVAALVGRPVCGCDGKVHPSDCLAYSDGTDLNASGCTVPPGSFACGYAVCSLQTQYCRHETKSADADLYTCIALPQSCTAGAAACECLRSEPCGTSCSGDARVGLTLLCQ